MSGRRFQFETAIERGDDEIELRVTYSVTPFIAATYWQPAEGGEVELISAKFTGVDAASLPSPLTDAEEAMILRKCEERAEADLGDEAAEEADWRYQEYRDRQLMERWESKP